MHGGCTLALQAIDESREAVFGHLGFKRIRSKIEIKKYGWERLRKNVEFIFMEWRLNE